jgi:hypothetical protein
VSREPSNDLFRFVDEMDFLMDQIVHAAAVYAKHHSKARLASIILFYLVEIKLYNKIILFGKFTEMRGYQTRIKVRHQVKIMKFQINNIPNFICGSQTNNFLNHK